MNVAFTERAALDLEDILAHSEMTFGRKQAEAYRRSLENTFDLLSRNPKMGKPLVQRPGLRSHRHRAHILLYRHFDGDPPLIVRLVDARRDWFGLLD